MHNCNRNKNKDTTLNELKSPPLFTISIEDLKQLDKFLSSDNKMVDSKGSVNITFSKSQWKIISYMMNTFLWIVDLLRLKKEKKKG